MLDTAQLDSDQITTCTERVLIWLWGPKSGRYKRFPNLSRCGWTMSLQRQNDPKTDDSTSSAREHHRGVSQRGNRKEGVSRSLTDLLSTWPNHIDMFVQRPEYLTIGEKGRNRRGLFEPFGLKPIFMLRISKTNFIRHHYWNASSKERRYCRVNNIFKSPNNSASKSDILCVLQDIVCKADDQSLTISEYRRKQFISLMIW